MRFLAVAGMVLALAGCGLPPAVTVAGYIADGMLLAVTGKTATDHGLSFITGRDCAMWRVLDGETVCLDRVSAAQAADAARVPALIEDRPADLIGKEAPVLVRGGVS